MVWPSLRMLLRMVWESFFSMHSHLKRFSIWIWFWQNYFVNLSIHNRFWIRVVLCYAWRTLLYAQAGPTWRDLYRISNSKECAVALKRPPYTLLWGARVLWASGARPPKSSYRGCRIILLARVGSAQTVEGEHAPRRSRAPYLW